MMDLAKYLIKKYEGLRLSPYKCPAGLLTIGYGHVIKKGESNEDIDIEMAEKLLEMDCLLAFRAVKKLIKVTLSDNQIASLISFTFNLGGGALERSALRQKLNRLEYTEAANEFLRWIYVSGKVMPGLVRRRIEEREIFIQ